MISAIRASSPCSAPTCLEVAPDLGLGLGVDQVDRDLVRLEEAPDAVDRLQPVVELEADAGEDRAVAVVLEVAAGAEHRRLGGEPGDLAAREGVRQLLVLLQLLRAEDRGGVRDRLADRAPLILEVVPQQEVIVGRGVRRFCAAWRSARRASARFSRAASTTPIAASRIRRPWPFFSVPASPMSASTLCQRRCSSGLT
jgi:hypothetical protein